MWGGCTIIGVVLLFFLPLSLKKSTHARFPVWLLSFVGVGNKMLERVQPLEPLLCGE